MKDRKKILKQPAKFLKLISETSFGIFFGPLMRLLSLSFLLIVVIYGLLAYGLTSQVFKERAASEIDTLLTQIGIGGTPIDVGSSTWGGLLHPLTITLSDMKLVPTRGVEDELLQKFNYEMHHLKIGIQFFELLQGKIKINFLGVKNLQIFPTGGDIDKPIGELTFHFNYSYPDFECTIEKCHLNPKDLMGIHHVIPFFFQDVDIPLNIQGKVIYKDGKIDDGHLILNTEKGEIKCPPFYPTYLTIQKLTSHVTVKDDLFIIEDLSFSHEAGKNLENVYVNFKGSASLEDVTQNLLEQGGGIKLSLQGEAKNIPVDNLSTLWPVGLAANARDWVTKNITVGVATKATLNLTGRYILGAGAREQNFLLTDLSGDIDASNVTVQYLDKLPFVTEASGACQYTQKNFTIQASGLVNGLVLKSGHINISDFDKEDETIDVRLELLGPVERALEIITLEPLAFPQKLGFDPTIFQGSSHTFLHLVFPLVKDLPLEKIMVETQSKIYDGKIRPTSHHSGLTNPLEHARLDLYVDNDHLELEGTASCLTIPTKIHWVERFFPDETQSQSTWTLSGPLSFDSEKHCVVDSQQGEFKLDYLVKYDKSGELSMNADLRDLSVQFPYFSLDKKKGVPLVLNFKSQFDKRNLHSIKLASLEGENILINARGSLNLGDSNGNLKKIDDLKNMFVEDLEFNIAKLGDLSGLIKISGTYENPFLKGTIKSINMEQFINNESISDSKFKLNGIVDVLVEQVRMSEELNFENLSCRLDWQNDFLDMAHVQSEDPDKFELILAPAKPTQKGKSQRFSLRSNNAGDLLDCFLPKNDLKGGVINMVGNRTHFGDEIILDAEIDVRDVVVKKAPFLAQLLSVTSFQGLLDTLSGSGIHFDSCRGRFTWANENLLLQDFHLAGGSIGLDIDGSIFLKSEKMSLVGEIYPLHGLNHLIAEIPLFGKVLSGGSSKGVFSTAFKAKGHKDHPEISVNPLTTFAPGAIRKVIKEVEASALASDVTVLPDEGVSGNGG